MTDTKELEQIDPNDPNDPKAEEGVRMWISAARLMRELQGHFTVDNQIVLSLALMLWTIRIHKSERRFSKADFLRQCESVWDSTMSESSDAALDLLASDAPKA